MGGLVRPTEPVSSPRASQNQFTVIQPGSTVATSLVEGEAKPKHVALLSIKDDNWKMESIPLTTVRPFLLREVVLEEHAEESDLHDERNLMDMLARRVDEMLREVKDMTARATPITQAAENRAKFPLLRLKVDYTGFSTCNPQRFGQRFVDKVANPSELLLFQRKARKEDRADKEKKGASSSADPERDQSRDPAVQIQDLVGRFLAGGKEQLRLLPRDELDTAVFEGFVNKQTKTAISEQVDKSLKQMQELLNDEKRDQINQGTDRKAKEKEIENFLKEKVGAASSSANGAAADEEDEPPQAGDDDDGFGSDADGEPAPPPKAPARSRGAAASKAAAADGPARGRGRGRGAAGKKSGANSGEAINLDDDDDDMMGDAETSTEQAPVRSKRATKRSKYAGLGRGRGWGPGGSAGGVRVCSPWCHWHSCSSAGATTTTTMTTTTMTTTRSGNRAHRRAARPGRSPAAVA